MGFALPDYFSGHCGAVDCVRKKDEAAVSFLALAAAVGVLAW